LEIFMEVAGKGRAPIMSNLFTKPKYLEITRRFYMRHRRDFAKLTEGCGTVKGWAG
jgi:hypothetical protein